MNYQLALEQLAAEQKLELSSLGKISQSISPQKIPCCGGWVLYVYAESAMDSSVVLRDASGAILCALHQDLVQRYPDILTPRALILFRDASFIPFPDRHVPSFLVVGLPQLAGLMLPEGEDQQRTLPKVPEYCRPTDLNVSPLAEPEASPTVIYNYLSQGGESEKSITNEVPFVASRPPFPTEDIAYGEKSAECVPEEEDDVGCLEFVD